MRPVELLARLCTAPLPLIFQLEMGRYGLVLCIQHATFQQRSPTGGTAVSGSLMLRREGRTVDERPTPCRPYTPGTRSDIPGNDASPLSSLPCEFTHTQTTRAANQE